MLSTKLQSATASGPNVAWDLAYAYYNPPAGKWDINTTDFVKSFNVLSQDTTPNGMFFKPDGLSMYVVGQGLDRVYQYTLTTAWDIGTASFLQFFSVQTQDTVPTGLFFKPDGTAMYVVGSGSDTVREYTLSTAWNISTASYTRGFSVATEDAEPHGLFFKPDGTAMYVVGRTGVDVNQYTLSTAWDVSTASYLQNFSVSAQETVPNGVSFKADGTAMYVVGSTGDDVNQYTLSTPWDISTASFVQLFLIPQQTSPQDIYFKPDGTAMYVVGIFFDGTNNQPLVSQYSLGGFSVLAQEANVTDVFFKPDGLSMYIIGNIGREVNQYTLSTAWNVSTASFLRLFSVSGQETSPQSLFFKPDGTAMYVMGAIGDDINQYTLSTAWDISTASFLQLFSIAGQETNPTGLFFSPDGTKMYVTGSVGDDVNQYALSTAWDVTTASFVQLFSVAAQEDVPQGVFFKPDGLIMYIVGSTGDDVNQYTLTTAWDISTASYSKTFSLASQCTTPSGIFFKPDGTIMYATDGTEDRIFQYSIGV
jgi:sugar lactone lactonase YvrE